ncbi:hypothetical protein PVL29_013263 [Vitis rotundifolia]|uniref:Uncharacterized protein n=1 Tax=Vitis rotundifolia TaxID=103349 RepID=A0AA38ZKZ1_VITRO|nr:hypothetical protein PVL29_013263 [Vitis rotundifolia]
MTSTKDSSRTVEFWVKEDEYERFFHGCRKHPYHHEGGSDVAERPITADATLMNPNTRILALKAQLSGTTADLKSIKSSSRNFEALQYPRRSSVSILIRAFRLTSPQCNFTSYGCCWLEERKGI